MRLDGAPTGEPFRQVLDAEAHLRWHATFHPFLREIPGRVDWIQPVHIADGSEVRRLSRNLADADRDGPLLVARWPDPFVRRAIAEGAGIDFARVAHTDPPGVVLHPDPFHRTILEARVAAGSARPVLGGHALEVIHPDELSWDEVHWLRAEPAWGEYRRVLADIEGEAVDGANSLDEVDARIHRIYADRLATARERLPSRRARLVGITIGFVAGEAYGAVLGAIPGTAGPAASVVGGAVGTVVDEAASRIATQRARPRWLAADHARRRLRKA